MFPAFENVPWTNNSVRPENGLSRRVDELESAVRRLLQFTKA
jgi:hypothetical protein